MGINWVWPKQNPPLKASPGVIILNSPQYSTDPDKTSVDIKGASMASSLWLSLCDALPEGSWLVLWLSSCWPITAFQFDQYK